MSAEESKAIDTREIVKKSDDEKWIPPPKMEATALSVLPNSQIPKETLEAFYDYCKENPQAKQAVDTVIKAFSPDTIGKFIENCEDVPLPTNSSSFEKFCTKYEYQVETKKEAPKVESSDERTKWNELVKEQTDGKISKERQEILTILTPWKDHPGHPELLARYGDIFLNPEKYPADSAEFRQAINGLLKELVLDAQKSGDGQDARKILAAANEMGAIATVDYVRLSRELDNLRAVTALDKAGGWPSKTDLPAGFHQMTTRAGEGEKFVNYSLGGKGACDEIVSFPKNAPDAKGNKTLVSAHSGYAVELVGVVDLGEGKLIKEESKLHRATEAWYRLIERAAEERGRLEAQLEKLTTQAGDYDEVRAQEEKIRAELAELEKRANLSHPRPSSRILLSSC